MPIYLIVLLSIAALIVFLLLMRVKVLISYNGEFKYAVKYLFFTVRIKNNKKGQATKEKNQPKPTFESIRTFIELFKRLYSQIKSAAQKLGKKLQVDDLKIDLTIGGDDAAVTAITYGTACATVYPLVSSLDAIVKVKKKQVLINADFNGNSGINFYCRVSIRLWNLLSEGIVSGTRILISLYKNPIKLKQRGVAK